MIYNREVMQNDQQQCVVSFTPNLEADCFTWDLGNTINRSYFTMYHVRPKNSRIGIIRSEDDGVILPSTIVLADTTGGPIIWLILTVSLGCLACLVCCICAFRQCSETKTLIVPPARTLHAHTANCYCIEFSPSGEYFAVGGADALVSLWSLQELVCMRTFGRLEWPVRTVSFSHDSAFIASGSEDPQVDIADVENSRQVHSIPCSAPMNSVSWHPTRHLLAYAGDDKNKSGQDEGSLRVFGFS